MAQIKCLLSFEDYKYKLLINKVEDGQNEVNFDHVYNEIVKLSKSSNNANKKIKMRLLELVANPNKFTFEVRNLN